jgi:hypothetical protein
MRLPLALLLGSALAACGSAGSDGNDAAPANSGNAATAASAPVGDSRLVDFRAEWLQSCIGGARDAAPAGTPVELHCACAIDRVMAGRSLAELEADQESGAYAPRFQSEMRACIAEIPG